MREMMIERRSTTALPCQTPPITPRKTLKRRTPKPDIHITEIGNYIFGKTLGEGNFAKVKLAKHRITGIEAAIKIIDKKAFDLSKLSKLNREVRVMKLLHHPNIIRLYEVIETKSRMFLVMEYARGGELYDYIVSHGRFSEDEARKKFRQIISAVSYCHSKRVIHRDLKAENLLLDADLNIKIADFGFSSLYNPDMQLDTFCGSPPYAAPELFNGRKYIGPELDIWSLGVILYVITTGCLPFNGKTLQEMKDSVCRGRYRVPFYLSEDCERLMRKFLTRDPKRRVCLEYIAEDPWMNRGHENSPVLVEGYEEVGEDTSLINAIHKKFNIPREVIIEGIRNNTYDENMAIYYLLYHQKHRVWNTETQKHRARNPDTKKPPTLSTATAGGNTIAKAAEHMLTPEDEQSPRENKLAAGDGVDPPSSAGSAGSSPSAKTRVGEPIQKNNSGLQNPAVSSENSSSAKDSHVAESRVSSRSFHTSSSNTATVVVKKPTVGQSTKSKAKLTVFVGGKHVENVRREGDADTIAPASSDCTRARAPYSFITPVSPQKDIVNVVGSDTSIQRSGTITERKNNVRNIHSIFSALRNASASKNSEQAVIQNPSKHSSDVGCRNRGELFRQTVRPCAEGSRNITMAEWEKLYPPPPLMIPGSSIQNEKCRLKSLHTAFTLQATTKHHPDDIITCFLHTAKKFNITCKVQNTYTLICSYYSTADTVSFCFRSEVCKLARPKSITYGLKLKRITGDSNLYKGITELFIISLKAALDKFVPAHRP